MPREGARNAIVLVGAAIVVEYSERMHTEWIFEAGIITHTNLCYQYISKYFSENNDVDNELATTIYKLALLNDHSRNYKQAQSLYEIAIPKNWRRGRITLVCCGPNKC